MGLNPAMCTPYRKLQVCVGLRTGSWLRSRVIIWNCFLGEGTFECPAVHPGVAKGVLSTEVGMLWTSSFTALWVAKHRARHRAKDHREILLQTRDMAEIGLRPWLGGVSSLDTTTVTHAGLGGTLR